MASDLKPEQTLIAPTLMVRRGQCLLAIDAFDVLDGEVDVRRLIASLRLRSYAHLFERKSH